MLCPGHKSYYGICGVRNGTPQKDFRGRVLRQDSNLFSFICYIPSPFPPLVGSSRARLEPQIGL